MNYYTIASKYEFVFYIAKYLISTPRVWKEWQRGGAPRLLGRPRLFYRYIIWHVYRPHIFAVAELEQGVTEALLVILWRLLTWKRL